MRWCATCRTASRKRSCSAPKRISNAPWPRWSPSWKRLDLPLDVRGTAFQQRVWQALRQIPAGQTVSYAELAARLGMPRAARAVAGACAANPVAIAIPCHRVVRLGGAISGYRWGVERKKTLLEREAAQ
jgi:AraC family transcriptional regulator of adaptative response/methylated-DNA-[protein]-cysteine methyltransferase